MRGIARSASIDVARCYNSCFRSLPMTVFPRALPSMKLIASLTSPYARKVRIALAEKKIEYELVEAAPWAEDTNVPAFNPLGKIPVLVLDDGTSLFDSRVIVEYLDTVSPVSRLIPEPNRQRIAVKCWEALADGICDAAAAIVIEGRRPLKQRSKRLGRASARQGRARREAIVGRARRQALVQRRVLYTCRHRCRVRARLPRPTSAGRRLARRIRESVQTRRKARKAAIV